MSEPQTFLSGRVTLHGGDCLDVLRAMPDCSVDSCVTDPPYHLTSIVKRFGAEDAAPAKAGQTGAFARVSRGFMGQQWDGGDIAFQPDLWAEVLRVLKPGGYVVAFSGTRTYHRMACAIEDAGFDIRDQPKYMHEESLEYGNFIDSLSGEQYAQFTKLFLEQGPGQVSWGYGSGFPKSLDISKAIDKAVGATREVTGFDAAKTVQQTSKKGTAVLGDSNGSVGGITSPATDAARQWAGWGTALKPAWEPICLARKPIKGTNVENVLRWGTGALNVDGCRVEGIKGVPGSVSNRGDMGWKTGGNMVRKSEQNGRFPANIIHDGSDEVLAAFPTAPGQQRAVGPQHGKKDSVNVYGNYGARDQFEPRGDAGSAARFFYSAKADADDRVGSKHPTVKPVDLMRWLVRLVTPPGGTCLDPFAGTGTTGEAAWREGMNAVLIEREPAYQADIERRMALCLAGPDERARAAIKARYGDLPAGPLFDILEAAK